MRNDPTWRGVALAAFSLVAGLVWEFGFWQADLGPTQDNWPIWVLPAPLWAAAVGLAALARRRGLAAAVGVALVAGVAAFGGGALGVVVHLAIYGTGD